jgi:hypothetical protein
VTALVPVLLACRDAFDLPARLPAGSFVQLGDGQVVRVEPTGTVEQLHQGARPWGRSVASDPAPRRDP